VFTGFDDEGCLGGGNFSRKLCGIRVSYARRSASDEQRRVQRETSCCNQDGRTVWYAL
jgi:hypothetical protein